MAKIVRVTPLNRRKYSDYMPGTFLVILNGTIIDCASTSSHAHMIARCY
jgi:hypothetical protein